VIEIINLEDKNFIAVKGIRDSDNMPVMLINEL